MRAAALIRTIQSERKSRRRTRRLRADCIIARSTASTARLKQFFRRPRNPRASLRTRLRRRRALKPLLTRIAQLSLLRKPVRERLLEMALVAALEHFGAAQVALALAALAQGQVVAAEGLPGLDLARPRRAEPLHRAPLRLQFRHRDRALLLCYGLRPPPVAGKAGSSVSGAGLIPHPALSINSWEPLRVVRRAKAPPARAASRSASEARRTGGQAPEAAGRR